MFHYVLTLAAFVPDTHLLMMIETSRAASLAQTGGNTRMQTPSASGTDCLLLIVMITTLHKKKALPGTQTQLLALLLVQLVLHFALSTFCQG